MSYIICGIDLEQMHHQGDIPTPAPNDTSSSTSGDAAAVTVAAVAATSPVGEAQQLYGRDLTAEEAERLSDEQKTQFATLQKAAREVWTNGGIDLSHRPEPAATIPTPIPTGAAFTTPSTR